MALNPLDEIMNRQAPADLGGGGLPDMGGGPPGMGGGPPGMGGGMPIPSGPAMGGSMPIDPAVGAEALDFAMGDPAMGMGDPAMGMAAEGLGDPGLGGEASTDEAANQVANVIVEMAPSKEEAMNLANAIKEKVASIVMGEDMGAEGDRLVDLGLGAARGGLIPGMQFGGNVPPPGTMPGRFPPGMPPPQAFQRGTLPQQFGQPSWMGAQGQGGSGPMGPPVGGGYQGGGTIQGSNARLDESLGARNRGPMLQSLRDRRNESKGMERAMGRRPYSAVSTMDRNGLGSLMRQGGGQMAPGFNPGFNPPGGPGQRLGPERPNVRGQDQARLAASYQLANQQYGLPNQQQRRLPPRRPPPGIRPGY